MRQLLRTFLILVLTLIVIAPFLIISITAAATVEKFSNILYDIQSVSFFSVNQSRADEQEIHTTNNSSCVNYDNKTMTINICGGMLDLTALDSIINNSK